MTGPYQPQPQQPGEYPPPYQPAGYPPPAWPPAASAAPAAPYETDETGEPDDILVVREPDRERLNLAWVIPLITVLVLAVFGAGWWAGSIYG